MPKASKTEIALPLRIVLVDPPPGVDFGIQEGKGNDYKTIAVKRSKTGNLALECTINVKVNRADGPPSFAGPISQGPPTGRFIYIDIGKSAGQFDSCWQRRIKISLLTITWDMIDSVLEKPKRLLQATIPGTGKDGGPSCATVKPIGGWQVAKARTRMDIQMDKVNHLLSFVANSDANMLTIHLDKDGIEFLVKRLSKLRELLDEGQCEDCHLFTADSIGSELTSKKIQGQVSEAVVVQHVKLCAWTQEWARKHELV